jgi:hypothetical protein
LHVKASRDMEHLCHLSKSVNKVETGFSIRRSIIDSTGDYWSLQECQQVKVPDLLRRILKATGILQRTVRSVPERGRCRGVELSEVWIL